MTNKLNKDNEALRRATLECRKFLQMKWENSNGNGLSEQGEEVLAMLKFIVFRNWQEISDHEAIRLLRKTYIPKRGANWMNNFWDITKKHEKQ